MNPFRTQPGSYRNTLTGLLWNGTATLGAIVGESAGESPRPEGVARQADFRASGSASATVDGGGGSTG